MTEPDLDTWKPAALREAEAQLDATMSQARKLIKSTEEKLAQLPETDHTAKPADVARLEAAAARPDAPAPMRALKRKVDAGELKWEDLLEGRALRDPDVRAALSDRLTEMREIYQEAEEGATLEEILEARGVTGGVFNDGGAARVPSANPTAPQQTSDEDYYTGSDFLHEKPHQSSDAPSDDANRPPQPGTPPAQPPQPHRSAPRVRPPEEPPAEDFFEDPLKPHTPAPQNQPPPSEPRRQEPKRTRRSDAPPEDDDYFGGPLLR